MSNILVADIGGTSSRFAHFTHDHSSGVLTQKGSVWLRSKEVSSFAELLSQLNAQNFSLHPRCADICVFAVAGPVEERRRSKLTNLPWTIDVADDQMLIDGVKGELANALVINDFLAQGFSAVSEIGRNATQVLSGNRDPKGAIAVIGAGTGLGKAIIVPTDEGHYLGLASEGGHSTLGISSAAEDEVALSRLLAIEEQAPFTTWEHVLSGKGLSSIHRFLTGDQLEPKDVAAKFTDPSENGSKTLELFARFYGRACRDFALDVLATGGVFIAGGIAAKNPEIISHPSFSKEFRLSKTVAQVLAKIPLFIIENEESGLWGAAAFGAQALKMTGTRR